MLGEQIPELKEKIIGQRVLDVEGPTMETSVSVSGNFKGTSASETLTFGGRPASNRPVPGPPTILLSQLFQKESV